MAKYIDASALKLRINPYSELQRIIDGIPAADVRPERRGVWDFDEETFYICTQCGERAINNETTPYCPHCGAKMDGKDEE